MCVLKELVRSLFAFLSLSHTGVILGVSTESLTRCRQSGLLSAIGLGATCGVFLHVSPRLTAYSILTSVFLSSMINVATFTAP